MKTRYNDISDADRELFRRSVGAVKKIKQDRQPARPKRSAPVLVPHVAAAGATSGATALVPVTNSHRLAGDELLFKRPGIQDQLFQKLRRGKLSMERELDLHGMTSKEAQAALDRFLGHCRQQQIRCVRIIHGKGRGSRDGRPVIKNQLNQWLRNIPQVLAFCPARAHDGGTGAVYVLLKIIR